MMNIQHIVVALDCGDTCETVFDQAVGLAQATQATLNLLSVLVPESNNSLALSPYSDEDWRSFTERYQNIKTARLELLQTFVNRAQEAGVKAECTQDIGSPGSAICNLAKTWNADLIMVGSHGRQGLTEMLLGSVSNYVVHHAPCSVMVVHGQQS
jgi:nucleotide-binding universal stress UspA family protein